MSSRAFINLVWPEIRSEIGAGEIYHVETWKDNAIAQSLDRNCGIDVWQILSNGIARGIASRVQQGAFYPTFTIRYSRDSGSDTEYHKRKSSILYGAGVYPYLTVQAYVSRYDGGELLGLGLCRTRALFEAAERRLEADPEKTIRRTTNASFIWVPWDDVRGVFIIDKRMDKQEAA